MICIQIVKKLFYKLSDFERARSTLLQFYASSALQRYGNNHKLVHEKLEETKNISKLYEILLEPIKRSRDETTRQLNDCRWQKRLTFVVALVSLTIAMLLIFIGLILIFTNHQQVGVISTIAGFLPGIISGLAFTFNKQANDNNDKF